MGGRITRRFRIVGKVQGVYFRHSTRGEATRLAIAGYARNLPDGSVEVLAQGDGPAVEELLRWLHRGPRDARVDGVVELADEPPAAAEFGKDFEVR
jgi:acylphosphatase